MTNVYAYYSSVPKANINWMMFPYIAYGKLTVLQGNPGEGKSTVAIQLCAKLTKAGELPNGEKIEAPVNVVYQCAEDGLADTIKPRLEAAGADCTKVIFICEDEKTLTMDDTRIERVIAETNCRFFVLDPFQAYVSRASDMYHPAKMRKLLRGLARIAERHNCAILLICHMTKAKGKNLHRILGSVDIGAIARSVLLIERDDGDPEIHYITQIKNNLAIMGDPLVFRLGKSGFQWLDSDYIAHPVSGGLKEKYSKCHEAAEMILTLLQDGPMESTKILQLLKEKGISERTAKIAKNDVEAKSFRKGSVWFWSLKNDEG